MDLGLVAKAGATQEAGDGLIRLARAVAVGVSIAVPVVTVMLFGALPPYSKHAAAAAAITAAYLPLHLRHVRFALRGEQPPWLWLTLGALAVLILGATQWLGATWFYAWAMLMASVLITLPARFSFPAALLMLIGVGVWESLLQQAIDTAHNVGTSIYVPLGVADRAAAVFVPIWLVSALRRTRAARFILAEAALQAERRRIDDELRITVAAELAAIAQKGVRAEDAVNRESRSAEDELVSLVDRSRRALADARRMIGRYKSLSPEAEFRQAEVLLRAAGIEARVIAPEGKLSAILDGAIRAALRRAVAELLSEEVSGPVVLRLGGTDDEPRFEIDRAGDPEPVG